MRSIWKFKLEISDLAIIEMPAGAEILCVQTQPIRPQSSRETEAPFIWAICDPAAKLEKRKFRVRGTGHPIDNLSEEIGRYVGSFQMRGGSFVLHVFGVDS